MDSFLIMLRLQLTLLVYLGVGIFAKKRGIVTKEGQASFTEFLVRIALPCMIFDSFSSAEAQDFWADAFQVIIISSIVCLSSLALGAVLYKRYPPQRRSVLRYGTLVSNAGFAGLQQVQGAFGPAGLMLASIYLLPLRIIMWSAGVSIFMKAERKSGLKDILLNPGMLAVYAGLPRMLLRIALPEALDSAIGAIGDCASPLSMIAIGFIIADIPLRTVIGRDVLVLTLVRLALLPAAVLGALNLFGADPVVKGVSVILTAMPVGVNTPILARKYGGDHEFASKCVLVSTVVSMVTLPGVCWFI